MYLSFREYAEISREISNDLRNPRLLPLLSLAAVPLAYLLIL